MIFSGTYRHTIDGKNRLAVPAQIRREFDRSGIEKLLVGKAHRVKGPNGGGWHCLQLTPRTIYESAEECRRQAGKITRTSEEFAILDDLFADVGQMEIDAQGRILIPDEFMVRQGMEDGVFGKRILESDVVVCGNGDTIAIWNTADHLEYRKSRQPMDVAA